jgi:hypoxanthine phosphoribosyltransferase
VREIKLIYPSWKDIYNLCFKIAKKINSSNFQPDLLVGVCRGGLVPLRLLSDLLDIKNVATIRVEFYSQIKKHYKTPKITQKLQLNIKNKKILVIDDVSDSGLSLLKVKKYLQSKKPKALKFATLHIKENAKFIPDFYASKTSCWIVYPWEINEVKRELKKTKKTKIKLK